MKEEDEDALQLECELLFQSISMKSRKRCDQFLPFLLLYEKWYTARQQVPLIELKISNLRAVQDSEDPREGDGCGFDSRQKAEHPCDAQQTQEHGTALKLPLQA